jgi:RHS repeat-associated protein
VADKLGSKTGLDCNHLGNVLAVVSDLKIIPTLTSTSYESLVLSATDYYPFGMQMPGRTHMSPTYRYGFHGMEKDDEVKGAGNSYTTEFRQYDVRIGRWKSIDLLGYVYPGESPYSSFGNNPIYYTDPSGLIKDGVYESDGGNEISIQEDRYTDGKGHVLKGFEDVIVTEDMLEGWYSFKSDIAKPTSGEVDMNGDGIPDGMTLNGALEKMETVKFGEYVSIDAEALSYEVYGGAWADKNSGGITAKAEGSVGKVSTTIGTAEDYVKLEGKYLAADAELNGQYAWNKNGWYGVEGKAGASADAVKGEAMIVQSNDWFSSKTKYAGGVGNLGVGGGAGGFINPTTWQIRAKFSVEAKVIVGGKVDVDVTLNVGNIVNDAIDLADWIID